MHLARQRAQLDWLAELCGAGALAAAAGYAALKAAPSVSLGAPGAMTAAGFIGLAFGGLAMRSVKPGPRRLPIAGFTLGDVEPVEPLAPLLLDRVVAEPLLLDELADGQPLLVD